MNASADQATPRRDARQFLRDESERLWALPDAAIEDQISAQYDKARAVATRDAVMFQDELLAPGVKLLLKKHNRLSDLLKGIPPSQHLERTLPLLAPSVQYSAADELA
jgi:hypothetical protein